MTDVDWASLPAWIAILIAVSLVVWAHRDRTNP
jgi:hypothetical protein